MHRNLAVVIGALAWAMSACVEGSDPEPNTGAGKIGRDAVDAGAMTDDGNGGVPDVIAASDAGRPAADGGRRRDSGASIADGGAATLTAGDVCATLVAATCGFAIRCDEWAGTLEECAAQLMPECCADYDCAAPVDTAAERLEACLAAAEVVACTANPDLADCEALIERDDRGEGPTTDAGRPDPAIPDPALPDAGELKPPYASCTADAECAAPAEGCFPLMRNASDTTAPSTCTHRCDGLGDRFTCGTTGLCLPQPGDRAALCYQACNGDTDCPRALRCREAWVFGDRYGVCAP